MVRASEDENVNLHVTQEAVNKAGHSPDKNLGKSQKLKKLTHVACLLNHHQKALFAHTQICKLHLVVRIPRENGTVIS